MAAADGLLQEERIQAGNLATQATGAPEYKSAADFDARFTSMLMDDEEKRRKEQEQKIERQKIAQSMSDLGAVFGDVIKASGGALVTPRDVQAKYDALDKNSQTVYTNYSARMDALRKGLQDRAKGDMDLAGKARENAANRELQKDLLAQKQAEAEGVRSWRSDENQKNREARMRTAQIRYQAKVSQAADKTEFQFTLNNDKGEPQTVTLNKAQAKMYIPDAFRWMVQKGYIDMADDAYPKKKTWNKDIWDYEYVPIKPTDLSVAQMYTIMGDFIYTMDAGTSDELLRRLQKGEVQQTTVQPAEAASAATATATPAQTTTTATTTTTGKKTVAGFGENK